MGSSIADERDQEPGIKGQVSGVAFAPLIVLGEQLRLRDDEMADAESLTPDLFVYKGSAAGTGRRAPSAAPSPFANSIDQI